MLRYLAFGMTLTGIIIVTQLYLQSEPEEPSVLNQTDDAAIAPGPLPSPTNSASTYVPQPDDSYDEVRSDPEDEWLVETTEVERAAEAPIQAWREHPDPPILPTRFSNRGIDARPLKVDKQEFQRAGVGDTVILPIPQTSQSYEMSVDKVGRHQNGDRTLKGHLKDQPEYTIVVTEGQKSTYATISTPEGSFMLEAHQDEGWLVAAIDLDSLVDPNLTDYQIPDINRSPN